VVQSQPPSSAAPRPGPGERGAVAAAA